MNTYTNYTLTLILWHTSTEVSKNDHPWQSTAELCSLGVLRNYNRVSHPSISVQLRPVTAHCVLNVRTLAQELYSYPNENINFVNYLINDFAFGFPICYVQRQAEHLTKLSG